MNDTRHSQLSWFSDKVAIQQDQDLLDFIKKHGYKTALSRGDTDYFSKSIKFVDRGPVDFCIYIQKKAYDFDDLVRNINHIAKTDISPGGIIYLAVNKYVAIPRNYDPTLPEDYDQAIEKFFKDRLDCEILEYQACGLDYGLKFNWVHPLTRFYLKCTT